MTYNENSIKVHKGLEGVRARPAMYIGDTATTGYHHLIWEVLDNSIDEAMAGHCNKIDLTVTDEDIITITDKGRGIPVKEHPTEKISTLDVVMTMLHAGGKFDHKNYSVSGGLHGVGVSCVNALSEWMEVTVHRDKQVYHRRYEKGVPVGEIEQAGPTKVTGTTVRFKPDHSIFKHVNYDRHVITRRLRELSYLNKNVTFIFNWHDEPAETFFSNEGLSGYVKHLLASDVCLLPRIVSFRGKVEDAEIEIAFAYIDSGDSRVHSFANNIPTVEGGVHYNATLNSLVKVVAEKADAKLKKHNVSVMKADVLEGIVLVVSIRLPEPEFGGQTKTRLNNDGLRKPLGEWLQKAFGKLFEKYEDVGEAVVNRVVQTAISRNAAKKAKQISRKKSLLDMGGLASKLKDCSCNDPTLSELFLVEGNSAAGGMVEGRNREYQAILPLRGKVLNTHSQTLGKIVENKEIATIISALGITVTNRDVDISELRYHKIIIACDADSDGGHISCLLLTMFHKFMRKLIDQGYIYVCEMPLYRVVYKGRGEYLRSDMELDAFKEKHGGEKYEISRFKGLGEMSVEELRETALDPTTRVLRKIHIDDHVETEKFVEIVMGKDSGKRREFLLDSLHFDDMET